MPVQVLSPGGVSLCRRSENAHHSETLRRRPDWRSVEDGLETDYGFLQFPVSNNPGVSHPPPIWHPAPSLTVPYGRQLRPNWPPEDIRTSTPLSPNRAVVPVSPLPMVVVSPEQQQQQHMHHHHQKHYAHKNGSSGSRGITKRHSVLWKLKPERWKAQEDGTLRRCRSKDDVLHPSPRHVPSSSSLLAASHPDLVTSHLTIPTENGGVPPALSILPPSRRNSCQTLPRRASHGSKDTLFARGKRWLASHRPDHKEHHKDTRIIPDYRLVEHRAERKVNELQADRGQSELTVNVDTVEVPQIRTETLPRKLRPRRPRTFYLLEDYLTPVQGGTELDECVGPRLLFPPPRPAPPTPDWGTPSLSPPLTVTPRTTASLLDPCEPSLEKSGGGLYSPVFSPRDNSSYPRFVTPEMSLSEQPQFPSGHMTLDGRRRTHQRAKVGSTSVSWDFGVATF